MLIVDINDCEEFTGGDRTKIREILNPLKEKLDLRYSLAHAMLKEGEKALPHRLKTSEVYYILQGSGTMHINDEQREVSEKQAVYIPPNSVQYIENTGDDELLFLCIVDPAWREEDEEVYKV
jgi:mannose-6-phosphate isomerase-like protein (cupin superfamily)